MRVSLAARLERQADKIARTRALMDEKEADGREKLRKLEEGRSFEAARLIRRVGLLGMTHKQLDGFIRSGVAALGDEKKLTAFERISDEAARREEAERAAVREPLLITFPADVPRLTKMALRKAGFSYAPISRRWESAAALFSEAVELSKADGGEVRRPAAARDIPQAAE